MALGRKLGARNKVELARLAMEMGLAPTPTTVSGPDAGEGESKGSLSSSVPARQVLCRVDAAARTHKGRAAVEELLRSVLLEFGADRAGAVVETGGPGSMLESVVGIGHAPLDLPPRRLLDESLRQRTTAVISTGGTEVVDGHAPASDPGTLAELQAWGGTVTFVAVCFALGGARSGQLGVLYVGSKSAMPRVADALLVLRVLAARVGLELGVG